MASTINRTALLVWCLLITVIQGSSRPESTPWPAHWLQSTSAHINDQIPLAGSDEYMGTGCQISNLTAYEMAKGRHISEFTTSAIEHLELPKIRPLNSSGGEQWEFDGVSEDGMQLFVFGFYRDPNYAILGTGNFRLSIEFAFADGKRFTEIYYPQRSIVESCEIGTRGTWFDNDDGYRFEFQVKADMSEAIVTLDSETLKGRVVIVSRSMPITADGRVWPSTNSSTLTVPYYHWSEPIPGGTVDVEVSINGREVIWSGMGGHEIFWNAFSWFTCIRHLRAVRAMLGPYVLTYFSFDSNIVKDLTHQSVVLFKDGIQVFRSTSAEASDLEPYALVTKTYDGAVSGTLKDKVTGFQLELVSPQNMQHYTFFMAHSNVGFEYILGEGVGGSGFSAMSRGGHVGLDQYEGIALTEALTFPKNSPLFKSNYV